MDTFCQKNSIQQLFLHGLVKKNIIKKIKLFKKYSRLTKVGFIVGFGTTVGAHRLYTHRTFKANLKMRIMLVLFQTVAVQNSMYEWVSNVLFIKFYQVPLLNVLEILLNTIKIIVKNSILKVRDHRVHHKFTDTNADPHNSKRGFFFSHIGWLCVKKHGDVKKYGSKIDMSDVENDPVLQFQRK